MDINVYGRQTTLWFQKSKWYCEQRMFGCFSYFAIAINLVTLIDKKSPSRIGHGKAFMGQKCCVQKDKLANSDGIKWSCKSSATKAFISPLMTGLLVIEEGVIAVQTNSVWRNTLKKSILIIANLKLMWLCY